MVHDLADRYFRRAELLQQRGKHEEAVGWLREVLLLDGLADGRGADDPRHAHWPRPSERREARAGTGRSCWRSSPRWSCSPLVRREQRLRTEFEALPAGVSGNLDSQLDRLDAVETFLERHHVWHGTLALLSERSQLRAEVDRLAEIERQKEEELARHLEDRATDADLLCGPRGDARRGRRLPGRDRRLPKGAGDRPRRAGASANASNATSPPSRSTWRVSASTTSETEPNR